MQLQLGGRNSKKSAADRRAIDKIRHHERSVGELDVLNVLDQVCPVAPFNRVADLYVIVVEYLERVVGRIAVFDESVRAATAVDHVIRRIADNGVVAGTRDYVID